MAESEDRPKKKNAWQWLLWWKIDPREVDEQITGYASLNWWHSARKISVLCLLVSVAMTFVFVAFGASDISAYLDAALMLCLAVFIYLGHRWAMVAAMLLWTFEKGISVADVSHGGHALTALLWWCLYMHAFYLAFRVEQEKRKRSPVPLEATS